MKRVIFDTNIYGKMLEKGDINFVLDNIPKLSIIIYGCNIIRKELRDTPKEKIVLAENKKQRIRMMLLNTYDFIVKGHQLQTTAAVKELAESYYIAYNKLGGIQPKERIFNDYLIISTAALNRLDVVYSEDDKTMLSAESIKSYDLVNSIKKLITPKFKSYEEFKNEISRK